MNKVILGTAVGLAVGYFVVKMMDETFADKLSNDIHDFAAKAKKKAKDVFDKGENEVEYMKERAEYAARKGKKKVDEAMI